MNEILRQLRRLQIPSAWSERTNPHTAEAHAATRRLALELGVITPRSIARFDEQKFARLASLAYPNAELPELTVANDFCAYLFFNDDRAEEDEAFGKHPERLRRFFDAHLVALREGRDTNPADPLNAFMIDIRRRILERTSPTWLERFASDVEQYLMKGTYAGAVHWTLDSVPSMAEYHEQRLYDSALFPSQDLIELAERIEIDDTIARSPELGELRWVCNHVVSFTNDLFSYAKEVVKFHSPNNLVHVTMAKEGVGLEEAASRCVDTIHRKVVHFVDLEETFTGSFDVPALRAYIAGLKSWMRGNLVWSFETGRYAMTAGVPAGQEASPETPAKRVWR